MPFHLPAQRQSWPRGFKVFDYFAAPAFKIFSMPRTFRIAAIYNGSLPE